MSNVLSFGGSVVLHDCGCIKSWSFTSNDSKLEGLLHDALMNKYGYHYESTKCPVKAMTLDAFEE